MSAEFDDYAASYRQLLSDPLCDRFASGSQFFVFRKWELLKRFLFTRKLPLSEQKWLDVGCGFGDLLRLGKSLFRQGSGCDVSCEMLSRAPDLDVRLQNRPDTIPYESETFDLVTAVCVYHHVVSEDMRAALTVEIKRVLKPGGVFCLIEHNPLNPMTRFIVRRTPVDANARLLGLAESTQMLKVAGMNVIGKEVFLYLPEMLYKRFSSLESALRNVPIGAQYALFAEKVSRC